MTSTREAPVCKMLAKKEALGAFVPSIFIRSREGSCFYFISEEETSQRASHEEFLFSEYRRRAFIRSEREGEHFQGSFHSAKCFHMSTLAVRGNVVSNYIPIILRVIVRYGMCKENGDFFVSDLHLIVWINLYFYFRPSKLHSCPSYAVKGTSY